MVSTDDFKYLGNVLTCNNSSKETIKHQLNLAKATLGKMKIGNQRNEPESQAQSFHGHSSTPSDVRMRILIIKR